MTPPATNRIIEKALPAALLNSLTGIGAGDRLFQRGDIAALPAGSGAYALVLDVSKEIPLSRPKRLRAPLAAGWYVYAGSAHGPGGIGARVRRHLRHDKPIHWHIDQLTARADVRVWATTFPHGSECDLIAALVHSGDFLAEHRGFGSSDCARCSAHLLMWQPAA